MFFYSMKRLLQIVWEVQKQLGGLLAKVSTEIMENMRRN